jgi:hypothetical protein
MRVDTLRWTTLRPDTQDANPGGPRGDAHAALTPRMRLRLARAVARDGWTVCHAAAVFWVAYPTAQRWAGRFRQAGPAGMAEGTRPSRTRPYRPQTNSKIAPDAPQRTRASPGPARPAARERPSPTPHRDRTSRPDEAIHQVFGQSI